MNFLITDTFIDSLSRLTGQEQKAVKTTAFDLQMNPAHPGLKLHKLDRARDPNFWSVYVTLDLRLIVHRTEESLLLCYTGHHDDAYRWAERRKLEIHPATGAAQLVEIRETVREITIPVYIPEERPLSKPLLFGDMPKTELLSYGVPEEWLEDVRQANEDTILELAGHLPAEAAEALLELATGGVPRIPAPAVPVLDPFEHPDAQRRFRVIQNIEELELALDYPWEKWTIFLHPEQRSIVEADANGPVRVSGSAGTGKTIVALHRAVHLARNHPNARVLLATFSNTLASALKAKLRLLIGNQLELAEHIEVHTLNEIGERLYRLNLGRLRIASRDEIASLIVDAAVQEGEQSFSPLFLLTEWEQVVDAWQLNSWEAYRDVLRLGRKTRLPESRRKALWSIYERVQSAMQEQNLLTHAAMFDRLAALYRSGNRKPFDFIVVDEAQDINVAQLRFVAALAGDQPNSLFFTGDLGQRIFQQPFSWKALGVDIRGRSRILHINYRTSHQIRSQADRLLAKEIADVDGNVEGRAGTISVFNGPEPTIAIFDTQEEEIQAVGQWLVDRSNERIELDEIGVFVRSEAQHERAQQAIESAGLPYRILDEDVETCRGQVSLCTMHLAKGLEFRAVAVMACDDEVIPLQERIEMVVDESDLEEVYNTERHLLYVACTRARDQLMVSGVELVSEFLDDLRM